MLIYALVLLWCFGGIYCVVENWRSSGLHVDLGSIPVLFVCGITIGPLFGLADCVVFFVGKILKVNTSFIIIKRKEKP